MNTFPKAKKARLLGGSVLVVGLMVGGAVPAFAQSATPARASCDAPVLDLSNPNPGDMLGAGGYLIEGTAFDPRAGQDSGIDKVSIFLDPRDQGGTDLGQTTPGVPSVALDQAATPIPDAFNLHVTLPALSGQHSLVAYAHSSLTGHETAVSVPIILNQDPSKAGIVVGTLSTESNTNPGANPEPCTTPATETTAATAPTAPTAAQAPMPATTAPAPATTNPVTVQLANPSPGDSLEPGGYVISGNAWDSRSQNGSGIDRLTFFLDSRDQGGLPLLDATAQQPADAAFTVTVQLPANHVGSHTLYVYAHSAVSDSESSTAVPISMAH